MISLKGEALTDLGMVFCRKGKRKPNCICCGSGGRSKAGQVSKGYRSCLSYTLNFGT